MNIRQVESLVAIVDGGSFAAAAAALGTTQSAISARIKELERYFGAALFDRAPHRAALTPAGAELLPYARQMLRLTRQAAARVGDRDALGGVLRLGVAGLVAKTLLPRLVLEIRRRYPRLALRLHVDLARSLAERLAEGGIDLALTTAPVDVPAVETLPIGQEEFTWLAGDGLAVPQGCLRPADVAALPVLGFPQESHHHPVISAWFAGHDVAYDPLVSSNNMDVLAALTVAGAGVALLPRGCYAGLIREGQLRALETSPAIPPVAFVAAFRGDALAHPATRRIAALASEIGHA